MKFHDITGRKFGRLTALARAGVDRNGIILWRVRCECGNTTTVRRNNLTTGNTKSCGCLVREGNGRSHGLGKHRLYPTWNGMMQRCFDKNHNSYPHYGGRGIKVCRRWQDVRWFIEDMGPTFRPGLTLDRKDNRGNYTPRNCRWATRVEQANNRRSTVYIDTPRGRMLPAQAAALFGIKKNTLMTRLYRGWSVEEALGVRR